MIDEVLNESYGEEFAIDAEAYMNKVFGDGACEILAIRKYGGIRVI